MFDLKDNKLVLAADQLSVPFIRAIWESDTSKTKEDAFREISYVFHMSDFKSSYASYPENVRREKITAELFKDKKWKPSKLVEEAIVKYRELSITPTMGLVEDAYCLIDKLRTYFRDVDFSETDEQGKPKYSAKDALSNLGNLGKVVDTVNSLKEKVDKEITSKTTVRGQKTLTSYSEPD